MHMSLRAIARRSSACRQQILNMTDDTKDILLNKEAIAIDHDKAGDWDDRVMTEGLWEVRVNSVAIFDRWTVSLTLDVALATLGLRNAPCSAGDVWEHQGLHAARGTYDAEVHPTALSCYMTPISSCDGEI